MKVTLAYAGPESRLDIVLTQEAKAPDGSLALSRSQIKKAIELGLVRINRRTVSKAGVLVSAGDHIEADFALISNGSEDDLVPYEFPLNILFEDDELIVIDKPANLTMHGGAGTRSNTLANALAHHLASTKQNANSQLPVRGGIVHRLDKNTSGVLVVAKNLQSQERLAKQFSERSVGRYYLALVGCSPRSTMFTPNPARGVKLNSDGKVSGSISTQYGRHPRHRTKMAVLKSGGRVAHSEWELLERFAFGALLRVRLKTGRTHQIRVHMEYLGTPVIGEPEYSGTLALPKTLKRVADDLGRQALHAAELSFDHPKSGKRLSFFSPIPSDIQKAIDSFRAFRG